MRIMHEAQLHDQNCFVTLTYAPGNMPSRASLNHRDYQLFMKRLTQRTATPVRFYMCGEYGETTSRPHYHACLFGIDFRADRKPKGKSKSGHIFYTSALLESCWKLGLATVQDLTPESAGYCAGYIQKKITGELATDHYKRTDPITAEEYQLTPEYSRMSNRPGIGARWAKMYHRDLFPHDIAVHRGSEKPVPRYYTQLLEGGPYDLAKIKDQRIQRAAAHAADNTPQRLAVQEQVTQAKFRNRKRDAT